jgi:hypothetical protein
MYAGAQSNETARANVYATGKLESDDDKTHAGRSEKLRKAVRDRWFLSRSIYTLGDLRIRMLRHS